MDRPAYEKIRNEFIRKYSIFTTMPGEFSGEFNLLPASMTEEEVWIELLYNRIVMSEIPHLRKELSRLNLQIEQAKKLFFPELSDDE